MYILRTIITVLKWGWSPILITALAAVGFFLGWETWAVVTALIVLLVIGLVMTAIGVRERKLELLSLNLRQLAGYFNRRFMGDSTLSIFTIIDTLFNIDNPQLWEWARACDMSRRLFNTWCSSFVGRVESDTRTRRFDVYLRTYLDELWLLNNHYHDFIEQFYEIAQGVDVPKETVDQYNRLVVEYNSFVQNFRDSIAELRNATRTVIEPPSVQMARELSGVA